MKSCIYFTGLFTFLGLSYAGDAYVGSAKCAQCHIEIASSQAATRMANSWHGHTSKSLPAGYTETKVENGISYKFQTVAAGMEFAVRTPGLGSATAPVETIIGGPRHGLSLLARVTQIGGEPLARPALVETRYLYSTPHRRLELSPGFSKETPTSWETAFGRVLAPAFEKRCLTCHGLPLAPSVSETGVRCESCHGPGQPHVAAVVKGSSTGIVNPAKFSNPEKIQLCGNCHGDARPLADPMPADLLISHQVEALTHSECYIQSAAGLSCTTCHDPHRDARTTIATSEKACRSCHSLDAKQHAALCPVNPKTGCVGCHMPTTQKDTFRMVDHWIRVVGGTKLARNAASPAIRADIPPKRAFLRILSVEDHDTAEALRTQIAGGASFFDLAQRNSTGPSALSGGYLGDVEIAKLDPDLAKAAAGLAYGAISPVIQTGGHFIILQRLPRDFRWRANELFDEAEAFKQRGLLKDAADKYQAALQTYPHFLRALVFFGSTVAEMGNPARAIAILEYALKLYPDDTGALYNLGIAYGAAGRTDEEVRTYERAIAIDPDLTPAYQNLGGALFNAGNLERAAGIFERGLQANPLAARMYYNLSLVREQQGRTEEARRLMRLATAIDPALAAVGGRRSFRRVMARRAELTYFQGFTEPRRFQQRCGAVGFACRTSVGSSFIPDGNNRVDATRPVCRNQNRYQRGPG